MDFTRWAGEFGVLLILILQSIHFSSRQGDTKKLGAVFHECSYLRSLEADGTVSNLARDDWFKAVEGRPKPSTQGLARADRVLSITQIGPDCAYAKVRCQITPRYFTDFLTMLKDDKGWRIVSKVYRTDTKL